MGGSITTLLEPVNINQECEVTLIKEKCLKSTKLKRIKQLKMINVKCVMFFILCEGHELYKLIDDSYVVPLLLNK